VQFIGLLNDGWFHCRDERKEKQTCTVLKNNWKVGKDNRNKKSLDPE